MEKKNIVILGAGFGGLQTALKLGKKLRKLKLSDRYKVLLIDKNSYHTYTPLLYEVATVSAETVGGDVIKEMVSFDVARIVSRVGVFFERRLATRLDFDNRTVVFDNGSRVEYEYLVVALGSEVNYFGIEGLAENALSFNGLEDALKIRRVITERAHNFEDRSFRVVVGGAGSNGVEVASELMLWFCGRDGVLPERCRGEVSLVDGANIVLKRLAPKVSGFATARLKNLGVEFVSGERIVRVDEDKLWLGSGRVVDFDVLIWTGGIQQSELVRVSGAKRDENGQVLVNSYLQMEGAGERVYGVGDSVLLVDEASGRSSSSVAPEAVAEADTLVQNILADIGSRFRRPDLKRIKARPHVLRDWPYIIPIGGKYAVARFGSVIIRGKGAWFLKGLVELRYLFSILPWFGALKIWLKGLVVFVRNERLG